MNRSAYFHRLPIVAFLLLAASLLLPGPAHATSIDPITYQGLVVGADFVGVVECTAAGGIVAEYRVVEAWKGPLEKGAKLRLKTAADYWGPRFPTTLVGERFVVTAYTVAPSNIVSTTLGGPVPVWWRDLKPDYRVPLAQGRYAVKGKRVRTPYDFSDSMIPLSKLRKDTLAITTLKPEEAELLHLKAEAKERLIRRIELQYSGADKNRILARHRPIHHRLANAKSPAEFVDRALRGSRGSYDTRAQLRNILDLAAGEAALKALEKAKSDGRLFGSSEEHDDLIRRVKRRVHPISRAPAVPASVPPLSRDRVAAIATAAKRDPQEAFNEFHALALHHPDVLADVLKTWQPQRDDYGGYEAGSAFGRLCGGQSCASLLADLAANASDDKLRVAAAAYLVFHDRPRAKKALTELAKLSSPAGAWAALELARRGDRSALPRALKIFQRSQDPAVYDHFILFIQDRVQLLLSNSAAHSGVPQPAWPDRSQGSKAHQQLAGWWRQNANKLQLHDPWVAELDRQGVN